MESPLATVPQSSTDPGLSWGNQSFNEFLAKTSLVSIANTDLSGDDENCPKNQWNIDVSNPDGPGWPCVPVDWVDRKREAVPHTRPPQFPYALSYSATYNHDGEGYNITLPGQLCADTVVGDFISPAGKLYRNASLATVHTALVGLPPQTLLSYTRRSLDLAMHRLYNALEPWICDPPPSGSRALLFRYSRSDRSGECCYAVLAGLTIPIFGGSMYIPLAHPGVTANWPGVAHWGVATFGFTLLTTYMLILDRLRRQETRLQQMEASTLNLFIIAGEYIRKGLVASWGGICATSAMLWQQVEGFCAESRRPGLQGPGLGPDPGPPQAGDPGQLEQVAVQNVCPPPETP